MTRKRKYDPLGGILGPGSPCSDYPITVPLPPVRPRR
jgi:hypothetical protein